MFALRCCTQHRYIGYNDHIVIGAGRQLLAEDVNFLEIVAQGAVLVLYNIHFFPRLAEENKIIFTIVSFSYLLGSFCLRVNIGPHFVHYGLRAVA